MRQSPPPPQSRALRRVLAGELCSGCGLCAGVSGGAVVMKTVAPGYSRPCQLAPLPANAEQLIASACPGSTIAPWHSGGAVRTHPYWGPSLEVATGHAADPAVRHQASSGGVISALLIAALEGGLVEAALHIAPDPDAPTRNRLHWSRNRAEVLAGAGSRYAASSPLGDIDAALASGTRFAFVGKPCDVSAMRQLGRHDLRVGALVPLMLSFFCGGVPSHDGADRIIRAMGLDPADVSAFRYRGHGWPGMARADTHQGNSAEMSYAESWGGYLSKQVQFRCKICPDAVGGAADIAAADAWYGNASGYPEFDERDGRSLIMVRTPAGKLLLAQAVARGAITTQALPIREIDRMQPAQARRKRLVAGRILACALMLQPWPRMAGLATIKAAWRATFMEQLRNIAGTVRRIIIGQR